jgi:hypothetical protein
MFGPKIRNVFKSRWHALLWSASILLTAYCTVPATEEVVRKVTAEKQVPKHANPWAKAVKPSP